MNKTMPKMIISAMIALSVCTLSAQAIAGTKSYNLSATAGFESGLKRLAKIDGILARRDVTIDWGDGVKTDALYANCKGARSLKNCEIWGTHQYDDAKEYNVAVRYRLLGDKLPKLPLRKKNKRRSVTATATVSAVGDFVVVSIGDSYYSGEGSPLHKKPAGNALWDEPSVNYYNDALVNYFNGALNRKVDGNGNEFINKKGIKTCHRSAISGPRLAGKRIAVTNSITHIHLACSGAKLGHGVVSTGEGADAEQVRNTAKFINEQLSWVRTRVPRIDVLLISAGGNNVGFSDTIKECLKLGTCVKDEPTKRFTNLTTEYETLAAEIDCRESGVGNLCAQVEYSVQYDVSEGGTKALLNVAYSTQDGRQIDTRARKLTGVNGGCYRFTVTPRADNQPLLQVDRVATEEDASCGLGDQGYDNSEPLGQVLYVRGEFDDWADNPNHGQRFINMGNGSLQAEFKIAYSDAGVAYKIASVDELLVPAVTLIHQYPDPTRNEDGEDLTFKDRRYCPSSISAKDWNNLHDNFVAPLHTAIADAATAHGWSEIDVSEFYGYCTPRRKRHIVHLEESNRLQGDFAGTAHPNKAGHQLYADQIVDTLTIVNPPRTWANMTTAGEEYTAGSITNGPVEVTLHAENPIVEAGVDTTYYGVNTLCNADTILHGDVCKKYEGSFIISTPGEHTVSFFTYNASGEPERRIWPVSVQIRDEAAR